MVLLVLRFLVLKEEFRSNCIALVSTHVVCGSKK